MELKTDQVLDEIDREKVRVKVKEIRDRVAICSTYRTIPGFNYSQFLDFAQLAMREPTDETLRIDDSSTPPPLTEVESFVKINDRVMYVRTDE